jgi:hypothetical protein
LRTLRFVLPAINAIGCLLFVLLREPFVGIAREAWEAEHRAPGVFLNSSNFALPSVACRPLHSWSEFHGGEALGLKVLESVKMVPVVIADLTGGGFREGSRPADVSLRVVLGDSRSSVFLRDGSMDCRWNGAGLAAGPPPASSSAIAARRTAVVAHSGCPEVDRGVPR